MQLFYCPDMAAGGLGTLDADESRHAVRVLRLREGDPIHVTDGRGHLYACRIVAADDHTCTVEAAEVLPTTHSPLPTLHLAVAPTKNPSRMEWLVEKAVEVGVGEITLLQCDHSERTFLKTDRLERLALSPMKQSLHTLLPQINPPVQLSDWLHSPLSTLHSPLSTLHFPLSTLHSPLSTLHSPLKFIAHCEADQPRRPLGEALAAGRDAVVLIGPEGDFSPAEIALALDCGFQPVSLGPSRLRTETAALYAACAFNLINDKAQ